MAFFAVLMSQCAVLIMCHPKGNKVPEKVNDKNDDDRCDSSSSNESEDSLDDDKSRGSDLLYKTKNGTKYK